MITMYHELTEFSFTGNLPLSHSSQMSLLHNQTSYDMIGYNTCENQWHLSSLMTGLAQHIFNVYLNICVSEWDLRAVSVYQCILIFHTEYESYVVLLFGAFILSFSEFYSIHPFIYFHFMENSNLFFCSIKVCFKLHDGK